MKIISFVGLPGSGKSEASKIARDVGIKIINGGDLIRNETLNRKLPITDENVGYVANILRKEMGMDAIVKMCIPIIDSIKEDIVLIDSIRNIEEVETLKNRYGDNFILIRINAPFDKRIERMRKRARDDDVSTTEQLIEREKREQAWGINKVMELAEISIHNNGDLDNFQIHIKDIYRNIGGRHEDIN